MPMLSYSACANTGFNQHRLAEVHGGLAAGVVRQAAEHVGVERQRLGPDRSACHVIIHIVDPRFLSQIESHDVASIIWA